jgi:hypothetical protein
MLRRLRLIARAVSQTRELRRMNPKGYITVTIAVLGALAGIALGDIFVGQIWPLFYTEAYKSVLPPNAPSLAFISDLIKFGALFSAGAICGVTSGFVGGRRFQVAITVVGYIYAFVKLFPYGFIEGTPLAFPIPVIGSGICSLGILAGFRFAAVIAGTNVRGAEHSKAG